VRDSLEYEWKTPQIFQKIVLHRPRHISSRDPTRHRIRDHPEPFHQFCAIQNLGPCDLVLERDALGNLALEPVEFE
jgi:hypothetical protein